MGTRNGFRHIGIVGCSAPGAALCYQTICTEGAALTGEKSFHPEVTMHTYPLAEYMRFIGKGDWGGVRGIGDVLNYWTICDGPAAGEWPLWPLF